jgi:hypothetical protein
MGFTMKFGIPTLILIDMVLAIETCVFNAYVVTCHCLELLLSTLMRDCFVSFFYHLKKILPRLQNAPAHKFMYL